MESILQTAVLLSVIALCMGYICHYIAQETSPSPKKTTTVLEQSSVSHKYITMDIVQEDFMATDRKCKIVIELFNDVVPKTCENFFQLCKNNQYAGVPFHRVINGFMVQGGDITKHDGTGGMSIYDGYFEDENFTLTHDSEGLLSMANSGPNTNLSQFFITLAPAPHLDGKHVVFGKVIYGMDHIRNIGTSPVDFNDRPVQDINIMYSEEGNNIDKDPTDLQPQLVPEKHHTQPNTESNTELNTKSYTDFSVPNSMSSTASHSSGIPGIPEGLSGFPDDAYPINGLF